MSDYQPKPGDRVRVILEGKVVDVDGIYVDIGGCTVNVEDDRAVVSVERLPDPPPPLPTEPGSQVRIHGGLIHSDGQLLQLGLNGQWTDVFGQPWVPNAEGRAYKIVRDLGADT